MSSTDCGPEKVASVSGMTGRAGREPTGEASGKARRRTAGGRATSEAADTTTTATAGLPAGPEAGPGAGPALVDVRRSARRRRTVSAYRDGDRTVVLIPARMSRAEERRWVSVMLERLERQDRRLRPGDDELLARARELSRRWLGGRAEPSSVRWVANQGSRWGSCTPVDRTIRLSARLQGMPAWVVDYVLVHELAHLLVPGHGPRFWAAVERYPRTERARGYLEGVSATAGLGLSDTADTVDATDAEDTGDGEDAAGGAADGRISRS
jgi:predicted metal-dependent hydrolase